MSNERVKNDTRLLKRALSATQSGVMITDATEPDDPIVYVNRAFEEITGYAAEEVVGRNPRFLQAGDSDQPVLDDLRKMRNARNDDVEWAGVLRNYKKDGTLFHNELVAAAVRDEGGRVANHIGFVTDVTERVRTEERLRFQTELLDAVGQAVVAVDLSGRIAYWNRAAERLYGWPAGEAVGRPADEAMVPEEQMERAGEIWGELVAGRGWSGEFLVRRRDGTTFPAAVTNAPVFDDRGNLVVVIGVSADVTERKEAEERLRRGEARLAEAQRLAHLGSWEWDVGTGEVSWSDEVYRIYGFAPGEFVPTLGRLVETVHHDDRGLLEERIAGVLRRGEPYDFEHRVLRPDGEVRVVHCRAKVERDEASEPLRMVGTVHDVTERKLAEEAFRESERRFRSVLRHSSDVVMILDADATIRYQSQAVERVLGYRPEELVGGSALDYLHPEDAERASEEFGRIVEDPGLHEPVEYRFRHKDGSWRWFEGIGTNLLADPAVGGIVVNSRDVTERKRAEEALRESERRFRQLFEQSVDALLVHDETGRMVDCNAEACRSLGYSREELLSLSVKDYATNLLSGEERARREREGGTLWQRAIIGAPGISTSFHLGEHRRKDGTAFPVEVRVSGVDYGGKQMILAAARDVTERLRAEEALRESEERLRSLVEQAADAIFVHDLQGNLVDVNRRACESLGYAREELLTLSVQDVEQNLEPGGFARLWEQAVSGGPATVQGVHRRKDGTTFPVEVRVGLFETQRRRLLLAMARDVTERKRAEAALQESEARFRQLFEQSVDALFVHDGEGRFVDCNAQACRLLGYSRDELLSLSVEDVSCEMLTEEERALKEREGGTLWQRALAGEPGIFARTHDERVKRKDGTTFPVEVRVGSVDYGGKWMIFTSARDVTERKALEERLEHQAFHDPLTGLPNRALFSDRLEHALARAERRGGKVAVLFMDLDNFKYVNDSLGHDAGDRLLAATAKRLEGCVRPEDTVARLGGDEFAVLLEGAEDAGEATRVAERAVEALREPFDLGEAGRELFAGTSVGIALGEAGRERPEDLLRKADLALYEAKRGGKARHAVFDPEAERRSIRRLELENGLRRAIERDEFRVCYQPVMSLKTGRVKGFEALVRWEHPERGLVSPNEFVPLAEENGLIVPIGRWVLRETCRQANVWQELCPSGPPPIVGVNLSARQLSHPGLVGDIEGILEETGLDPSRLTLEITESVLVEDAGRHAGALRGLKDLGVRFAIDDFGTGYSSLSYLKRLPADLLKLDGSFVGGIEEGPGEDEVLLEGVIGIAHGLGLVVVAEGVETAGQAARLRGLGCDLAQGNHFSKPLPSEEAAAFLTSGA